MFISQNNNNNNYKKKIRKTRGPPPRALWRNKKKNFPRTTDERSVTTRRQVVRMLSGVLRGTKKKKHTIPTTKPIPHCFHLPSLLWHVPAGIFPYTGTTGMDGSVVTTSSHKRRPSYRPLLRNTDGESRAVVRRAENRKKKKPIKRK